MFYDKNTKGARGGMSCDRKVWTLSAPSTTDCCQKTTRGMVHVC